MIFFQPIYYSKLHSLCVFVLLFCFARVFSHKISWYCLLKVRLGMGLLHVELSQIVSLRWGLSSCLLFNMKFRKYLSGIWGAKCWCTRSLIFSKLRYNEMAVCQESWRWELPKALPRIQVTLKQGCWHYTLHTYLTLNQSPPWVVLLVKQRFSCAAIDFCLNCQVLVIVIILEKEFSLCSVAWSHL